MFARGYGASHGHATDSFLDPAGRRGDESDYRQTTALPGGRPFTHPHVVRFADVARATRSDGPLTGEPDSPTDRRGGGTPRGERATHTDRTTPRTICAHRAAHAEHRARNTGHASPDAHPARHRTGFPPVAGKPSRSRPPRGRPAAKIFSPADQ
ncbi:hypothetical protein FMEAI12_4440006 [Parafrankia sp. Ea1.12]|nr:hypothetical protein FMEAI12_4440006 [Parafrankia sp. Ea1.12]